MMAIGYARAWLLTGVLLVAGAARAAEPAPPAAHEQMGGGEATSILGREIAGPDGRLVGRIVDLLVDDAGQPRAAVVDVGGFMGFGNRRIAVAWRSLRFAATPAGPGEVTLDMTVDQIIGTPDYEHPGKPVTVAAPPPAPTDPQAPAPQ